MVVKRREGQCSLILACQRQTAREKEEEKHPHKKCCRIAALRTPGQTQQQAEEEALQQRPQGSVFIISPRHNNKLFLQSNCATTDFNDVMKTFIQQSFPIQHDHVI